MPAIMLDRRALRETFRRPTLVRRDSNGEQKLIDEKIDQCGLLPSILAGSISLEESTRRIDIDGIPYDLLEQRRRLVNDVTEQSYLQDLASLVWPGAIIQGQSLLQGDVAEIKLRHGAGTVQIGTDLVTGNPKSQAAKIAEPSSASIGDARRDILRKLNPKASPGILKTDYQRAHTLREIAVKLGLDVRGGSYGVQLDASYDSSYKSTTVVATIRQTFYVASFDPEGIGSRAFHDSVEAAELNTFMGSGNPPLMIDSVHYGRLIVVTATAKASSEQIRAALKAQWDASSSKGDVRLSAEHRALLEGSQVRVYAIGAVASTLPTTLTDPVTDLDRVYREGLNFSLDNPGAPIAFTARHLRNWSLAHVGLSAEYVQPVRAVAEDVDQSFQVWDGPGGGPVDTGIEVAPGDKVDISAYGQVWSGVFAAGTHGPEGWPGWDPPGGAPTKNANAHCLIAKFDSNGDWFKIGNSWSGTNNTEATRRLQLNINDNNPYNGDPNQRFTVQVKIARRPASAAGLYV